MKKKMTLIALLLALLMVLSACAAPQERPEADAQTIEGGTQEDPWLCGADQVDDVQITVMDNQLIVEGAGAIADYEDPADRPWNAIADDIEGICLFGDISRIGKNAFSGLGKNSDYFDILMADNLIEVGESAFEGTKLDGVVSLTKSVTTVEKRAFADSTLADLYFLGKPGQIADDAFENVNAKIYVVETMGWDENERKSFGGELTYQLLCRFEYQMIYEGGECSEEGTNLVPKDEEYGYFAEPMEEGYEFDHWEVEEGDLTLEDPQNPDFHAVIKGDVKVCAYFKKK